MGLAASLVVVPMCLLAQGLLVVPLVRRLGASATRVDRGEEVRA
jgi:hypothetical protein